MMEHYKNKDLADIIEIFNEVVYCEVWKDIDGYEGMYQISNFGRVKSIERAVKNRSNGTRLVKERIRSLAKDKDGYLMVTLSVSQHHVTLKVHRLVGDAFIPNPNNLPEINHLKRVKTDNRYHQLEWSTALDNTRHSFNIGERTIWMNGRSGEKHHLSKRVYCPTLEIYFGSAAEAERELGLIGVGAVCKGHLIHAKGLSFRYV